MTLDTSIYLSIAALVISVITAWLNWRHTNKTFRQTSDPELLIEARLQGTEGTVWLRLTNLHMSVTASNLKCVTYFTLRPEKYRPHQSPWFHFHEETLQPLAPSEKRAALLTGHNLVRAIAQKHSDFLVIENGQVVMLREQAWNIRVEINYRGAIAGSSSIQARKDFSVRPVTKKIPSGVTIIDGWDTITN